MTEGLGFIRHRLLTRERIDQGGKTHVVDAPVKQHQTHPLADILGLDLRVEIFVLEHRRVGGRHA